MFSKYVKSFVFLVCATLLIAGCSDHQDAKVKLPEKREVSKTAESIGFVVSTLKNPFFEKVKEGVESASLDYDHKLVVLNSDDSVQKEIVNIKKLVDQGVKVVILNAIDSKESAEAVRYAELNGVKVVLLDRSVDGVVPVAHMTTDDAKGGALAAEYIARRLEMHGKVIELEGVQDSPATLGRSKGFSQLAQQRPDLKIMKERADFKKETAEKVMKNLLKLHPDISAVFAHNDEMALGAEKALEDLGIGGVVIVGYDGTPEGLGSVTKGGIDATIAQQPFIMGELSYDVAESVLQGNLVQEKVYVPLKLIGDSGVRAQVQ